MCRSLHFCRYVVRKYFRTFVVPRVRRTTTDSDHKTVQRTLHVPSKISYLQYVYSMRIYVISVRKQHCRVVSPEYNVRYSTCTRTVPSKVPSFVQHTRANNIVRKYGTVVRKYESTSVQPRVTLYSCTPTQYLPYTVYMDIDNPIR